MESVYTRKASVRSDRTSKQHEITIEFNMVGATEADVIEAALRQRVVDVQAALRRLTPQELADVVGENNGVIKRSFVEPGKGIESTAKQLDKLTSVFAGLSPEQQKAFLAQLKRA